MNEKIEQTWIRCGTVAAIIFICGFFFTVHNCQLNSRVNCAAAIASKDQLAIYLKCRE